jgi:hypothetical protein
MSNNKPTVCCGQDYKDVVNKIKNFGAQINASHHPHISTPKSTPKYTHPAATTQSTFFNLTNNGFLRYQKK